MSDNSAIEWTDASWPVTTGCEAVSPGCDHCYAADLTATRLRTQPAYAGLATKEPGKPAVFTGEGRCHPDRLGWPLRWRKPRRIFVCSMSDLFHGGVPNEFIARVFAVMAAGPQHTFQVLSKRHARMRWLLSSSAFRGQVRDIADTDLGISWPLPNVWCGVSVEDNEWARTRIPSLLRTPAAVRFISAEPLLGPIDLEPYLWGTAASTAGYFDRNGRHHAGGIGGQTLTSRPLNALHWIITGGESGPDHRPADLAWFRSIRDQCAEAGVAYLHKQNGGHTPKSGGRELDGRTWDEYPAVER